MRPDGPPLLAVAVVGVTLLAGCASLTPPFDCDRTRGGQLAGSVVETAPPEATLVNVTDESLADAPLVRGLVNGTVDGDRDVIALEPAETCRVRDRLAAVPSGDDGTLYVRSGDTVVRVRLALYV